MTNPILELTFRKATPEDIETAVPLIYSTGPPTFEYAFKISEQKDAIAFLNYVFVKDGSEFSYTNHICMLNAQREIVGIASHFGEDAVNGFTRHAIRYIFSFYGLIDGFRVLRRGLQVEKIITPPVGDTEVIAHLAISPSYQSKGLGTIFLQHLFQEAKQKRRSTVSLDVSHENPRAKCLYERSGFTIHKKMPSALKNNYSYVADHYKMYKNI